MSAQPDFQLRRVTALAEAYTRALNRSSEAAELYEYALWLRPGFVGFKSEARLALADSLLACGRPEEQVEEALQQALRAAHNVEQAPLLPAITARVNGLIAARRTAGETLVNVISRLANKLSAVEFAALHWVGEQYSYRYASPERLPVPEIYRETRTLRALAEVYSQPLRAVLELNSGLDPNEALHLGTPVRIPDPRFMPLLAAYLSAAVLADSSLSNTDRVTMIKSLVPIAVQDPTALDTVLARLLLADLPRDPAVLQELEGSIEQ